jgi:hypothetical protein
MQDITWHDAATFLLVLYIASGVSAKVLGKGPNASRFEAVHLVTGGLIAIGSVWAKRQLPPQLLA